MKRKLFFITITLLIIMAIVISIVFTTEKNNTKNYINIDTESTNLNVEYTSNELTGDWSNYNAKIQLNTETINIEGSGVTNSGKSIIISTAGTYYLTGTLLDGNILIQAGDKDDIQLVLDNVSISSTTTAPINGITAGNLTITLKDNTINTITDSSSYTNFTDAENQEPDGAIFTKTDLIINGNGKLTVNGNYKDGIVCKDELKIANTNIEIISEDDGIRGTDYVIIKDSNINITSNGDGIKSTNSSDSSMGYVAIEGGNITVSSKADAIQAETVLNISSNSNIKITTTGEISSSNSNQFFGFRDERNSINQSTEDSTSSKGLKAGTEITIENGTINISSTDDSIHSNGIVIINNGNINTSSDDDGIHADTNIVINDGNINVTKSYEGIESNYIEINGGKIEIIASDDGINVAGGNDDSAMGGRMGQNNFSMVQDTDKKLVINDGTLTVNASGDGLDSNGAIYINGGATIVAGPTNSGNGALDYTTECVVTGGTFIVYGVSGMWQNPSNSSTQYCLTFGASGSSNDKIVLKNSSEKEIASINSIKTYQAITISTPDIKKGETYSLYINDENVEELKVSDIITSNSFSGGGMHNMQPGRGGKPGW